MIIKNFGASPQAMLFYPGARLHSLIGDDHVDLLRLHGSATLAYVRIDISHDDELYNILKA